ncbi:unnamed protein product [Sphenostylis stenocarpa]|uniref:Uncharacterized protein n=1 Tax=Sphenostylis stenocarpa TaxID=92480 RepID=A0AA86SF26_9FABA|nr:unnamed protein product [Sphenostylis stenocarpa]
MKAKHSGSGINSEGTLLHHESINSHVRDVFGSPTVPSTIIRLQLKQKYTTYSIDRIGNNRK